jgi:AGZA family xanthine/uracil permease-like MFS transporter
MSQPAAPGGAFRYRWASLGDLNAFFALMLDNMLNLVALTALLTHPRVGFPLDKIFSLMIPGTALGVLIGDAVYTWMAARLARRDRDADVTAMPLGLDTPSTIGIALIVLAPAFVAARGDLVAAGMDPARAADQAAYTTWTIGMAVMMIMGLIKTVMSFLGDWIRRMVPRAGLLGSIGGIGLALLAFIPLRDVFEAPVVGLAALGLVLYTLVARLPLPGNLPGAAMAVLVGTGLYYGLGPLGLAGEGFAWPALELRLALPLPTLGFIEGFPAVIKYLPLAIPFGLLTIIGGINVTESARVAGDAYSTRDILLTEAIATLAAGLCGGVSQSTPYIGHPAYKAMGARAGYTLATGLFVGLGGMLGYVQFVVGLIPKAAVMPILIFIGLEIITQAYHETPRRHTPAVSLSFLPSLGQLGLILVNTVVAGKWAALGPHARRSARTLGILGNGFIITAMLWGGGAAHLIDRRLRAAAVFFLLCGVLALFGLIHSVHLDGSMYLPWAVGQGALQVWLTAGGYGLLAGFLLLMSGRTKN